MPHLSPHALKKMLEDAAREVEVGAVYVHYKDASKAYVVKGFAVLEATDEPAVVYEWEYEPRLSFIRPLRNFVETVMVDGASVPRFRKR